jgi:hypothetical protein
VLTAANALKTFKPLVNLLLWLVLCANQRMFFTWFTMAHEKMEGGRADRI